MFPRIEHAAEAIPGGITSLLFRFQKLRRTSLSARLAEGAFWTVTGTAFARLLGLLSSIVCARFLSKEGFGQFAVLQSTVAMMGTFAGLGLAVTATKHLAEWRDIDRTRCSRVVSLTLGVAVAGGILGTLLCAGAAPWLAVHTLAAPELTSALRLSSPLVLLVTVQNVYTGALAGLEGFKAVAVINFIPAVLGAPLVALGAWEFGISGAIAGLVIQNLAACVLGHYVLVHQGRRHGIRFRCLPEGSSGVWLAETQILWRFSLPAFLSSTLVGPVNWFCNMLLVNQKGGYGQAALLSAANQWKNVVGFLPLMLGSVLVPMLANLHAAGRGADFIRLLKRQLWLSAGICMAMALPLIVLSSRLMKIYGGDYGDGAPVLVLTLCTTSLTAINNLLSKSMQSAGRAWLDLGFSGIWAAVLICASLIFIPRQGAMGVAIAQAFAAASLGLWQWRVLRRVIGSGNSVLAVNSISEAAS
ncbi:MAG TPA: oligosaccharide flippase family protein [Verrucomicrobiae bacterium]|nr:oligosaccharide flippase family protein [Verrucomicrobiae bacterium]